MLHKSSNDDPNSPKTGPAPAEKKSRRATKASSGRKLKRTAQPEDLGDIGDDLELTSPIDTDDLELTSPIDTDDLELTTPVDEPATVEMDDVDKIGDVPEEPKKQPESPAHEGTNSAPNGNTPPGVVLSFGHPDDDGDDPYDFDDLGDLADVIPPIPPLIRRPPPPVAPAAPPQITLEPPAPEPPAPEPVVLEPIMPEPAMLEPALPEPVMLEEEPPETETLSLEEAIEPEPIESALPEATRWHQEPEIAASRDALEEAPASSFEASLAMEPIPELQTGLQTSNADEAEPAPEDPEDDVVLDLLDEVTENDDDHEETTTGLPEIDNDDDDEKNAVEDDEDEKEEDDDDVVELILASDDAADIDALDIDGLEIDLTDPGDERIEDDWHAHLADALGADRDGAQKDEPPATSKMPVSTTPADERSSVLPLSKTLTRLATGSEATDLASTSSLTPPPPNRGAGQGLMPVEVPAFEPAETAELTLEQVPSAIIASLPRLRRFAQAQIGDERMADRLLHITLLAALGDMPTLHRADDLGLALMTLLHRQRQDMLDDRAVPQRATEAARVFEMTLCRGLAGADQFEINEFAQAINGIEERDRELLILLALENLTYPQIAGIIGQPSDTIVARVAKARIQLRRALALDDQHENAPSLAATAHDREMAIHGYLDGELDAQQMADIDALLEYDEDAADRLLHYGIQGDLIRRLYAPLINNTPPGTMLDVLTAAIKPARWGFLFGQKRAVIGSALIIALGCGAAGLSYLMPVFSGPISDAEAISSTAPAQETLPEQRYP